MENPVTGQEEQSSPRNSGKTQDRLPEISKLSIPQPKGQKQCGEFKSVYKMKKFRHFHTQNLKTLLKKFCAFTREYLPELIILSHSAAASAYLSIHKYTSASIALTP